MFSSSQIEVWSFYHKYFERKIPHSLSDFPRKQLSYRLSSRLEYQNLISSLFSNWQLIFSGLKLKKNGYFFIMEWFIIFQTLAKLSQWIVKPELWLSDSKIFGLTFPHNKYWICLFKAGSDRKGLGWGESGERHVSVSVGLLASPRGTPLFLHCTQSCPCPRALPPSCPLLLSFGGRGSPPHFPLTPSSCTAEWVGADTVMVGNQEESTVKTTPGPFSQALVMKGLNEP